MRVVRCSRILVTHDIARTKFSIVYSNIEVHVPTLFDIRCSSVIACRSSCRCYSRSIIHVMVHNIAHTLGITL